MALRSGDMWPEYTHALSKSLNWTELSVINFNNANYTSCQQQSQHPRLSGPQGSVVIWGSWYRFTGQSWIYCQIQERERVHWMLDDVDYTCEFIGTCCCYANCAFTLDLGSLKHDFVQWRLVRNIIDPSCYVAIVSTCRLRLLCFSIFVLTTDNRFNNKHKDLVIIYIYI